MLTRVLASSATEPLAGTVPGEIAARANLAPTQQVDWLEAVRGLDWQRAAAAIDALPPAERTAGVRFVRARAASELGDGARTLSSLEGLERELPELAREIGEARARALLEVGPFDTAAKHFAAQDGAAAALDAALAHRRAKDLDKARAEVRRAFTALAKTNGRAGLEARAHRLAADIACDAGRNDTCGSELRWLAVNAPAAPEAEDAAEKLGTVAPKLGLSRAERFARAKEFARRGWVDRTERELESMARVAGKGPGPGEITSTRATSHYASRTSYQRAHELYLEASKSGDTDPARELFLAARSLSRADHDDQAQGMYEDVARHHPKSGFAQSARYCSARIDYLHARWKQAEQGYNRLLARYGEHGRYADDARYERAIAWLAGGEARKAEKALAKMAKSEDDPREQARLLELHAVALLGAGKKAEAIVEFRRVVVLDPMSLAALASAARLTSLEEMAPTWLAPASDAPAPAPLSVELPPKAELLRSLGLDADAEREIATAEQELRRRYGPRADEALCQAYARVSGGQRQYRTGQRAATREALGREPNASSRWLWECVYPRPYASLVTKLESDQSLADDLMYAVMRQESAFRTDARSPANARGLMQLIPSTAQRVAEELDASYEDDLLADPAHNLRFGAYYLGKVYHLFGDSVPLAAAAYNAGPVAVSRWLSRGEALPLDVFVAWIPYAETRTYVARVMGNLARYQYLKGGASAVLAPSLTLPHGLTAGPEQY
jgi:soluble lytic murein transglycosylase